MDNPDSSLNLMKSPLKRRHVIFLNGECRSDLGMRGYLREEDYLIGVDGGTNHIIRLGLWPDEILGDMDSIDLANLLILKDRRIKCSHYPIEKDQTDLELALERSLGLQPRQVVLANATGGRADHFLGNLMVVLRQDIQKIPVEFFDGDCLITCLHGPSSLVPEIGPSVSSRIFKGVPGQVFSLLPITTEVHIERLSGSKWELRDVKLPLASGRGISNIFQADTVEISIKTGSLLVILPEFNAGLV
jgi:thiamine pyrophosphokinase